MSASFDEVFAELTRDADPRSRPRLEAGSEAYLCVSSEPTLDGGAYMAVVSYGQDLVIGVPGGRASRYALAVIAVSVMAEYDVAMMRQLGHLGVSVDGQAQVIADTRMDRRPPDDRATGELVFRPIVSARDATARVMVFRRGQENEAGLVTRWSPVEARHHAMAVLQAAAGVDHDDRYRRYLVARIGIEDWRARNVVADIGHFIEDNDSGGGTGS